MQVTQLGPGFFAEVLHRGRPWPDHQPRHVGRTPISATDVDGLHEMWPPAA